MVQSSQIERFLSYLREHKVASLDSYTALYDWSLAHPEAFWKAIAEFSNVVFSQEPTSILALGERFQDAQWFVGAKLNFAENLIGHGKESDATAISFWNEHGKRQDLSYRDLYQQVARAAHALRSVGVGKGDVVAGFIPNIPEAAIAMLAATSLGAVWTSSSPEFSVEGVLDRFGQVAPKVLITADGYYFKGKRRDSLSVVETFASKIDSLEHIFVVSYTDDAPTQCPTIASKPTSSLSPLLQDEGVGGEISFEQVDSAHPVYIMYSSGTTGAPKCMLHGTIGTLLEHKKELLLHTNVTEKDALYYRTTTGWMMWNWYVSTLSTGAKVCMYDGDLNSDVQFEMIEQEGVTVFGTAAGHVQFLKNNNLHPSQDHDLSSVRTVLSTGSTLWPELFDYAREAIGEVQIASISGGTDLIGCFALGCPVLPVHRGELQTRSLGYGVDVYDGDGRPVRDQVGELVCTAPFPSMPVSFLHDPDGAKYHGAYFDTFENVWCHGDAAILYSDTGGLEVLGRSDDTLNPGGERFGPSVITNLVDTFPGVSGSTAVAVRRRGEERVVLFVKMGGAEVVDDHFRERVKHEMVNPRYRPHFILEAPDFPFTRSGKLSNKTIRSAINGEKISNLSALANPEVVSFYEELRKNGSLDF
ncbi:MAG: acetoacetate--CoA ligase [Bdellovibrionales bacterium]|nr:acetoacetate--CoA ligase [Bdellovibrionales bacterium]